MRLFLLLLLFQKALKYVSCDICSSNDVLKKYMNFLTIEELCNLFKGGIFFYKNSSYKTIFCEILIKINRL